jgi:alpha-glucosidase
MRHSRYMILAALLLFLASAGGTAAASTTIEVVTTAGGAAAAGETLNMPVPHGSSPSAAATADTTLDVLSPDGSIKVTFALESYAPTYRVQRFGADVIVPSQLGFVFKEGGMLAGNLRIVSSTRSSFDETWTQPWGEKKDIRNYYDELRVDLEERAARPRRMTIVLRVFDDGLGFRYELPAQENLGAFEIMDELTEFVLAADYTAWWIPAYQPNRYEYLYKQTPVSSIRIVHTPLTMETADGLFLSIHEAALTDYASMTLANRGDNTLKADLVPWSDGVRVRGSTPFHSPWRTIQIGDEPGDLITSYLILNLNEPNKLGDVSWVEPGTYIGIWWAMHLGIATWGSGPKHGATTANVERYMDFAARHGFDRVLVEGWNVGWDGNWTETEGGFQFTRPYPDFDIAAITTYGAARGVRLIGHHETGADVINYERQMEDAFDFYNRYGINTVKTGYVGWGQNIKRIDENGTVQREWHHGQYMVRHYRKVVESAARHRIMLDVHEPIKDTGIRRTYPNMMTREGARGQEYNAWSDDGGNPPEHETILPFTRLLAGPMDFTPGIFDLFFSEARPNNRVNTTLAKQLALYVVIYSPLQMAADLPANYEANLPAFRFIEEVPADWEDTKVLHGRIGDYVTIVRKDRRSDDWYLGSVTDELGRKLEAPLSFLSPGKKYVAEIYRDGRDADWRANPLAIEIAHAIVDNATVLDIRLAPGGGQAIRFRPATSEDIESLPPYERQ